MLAFIKRKLSESDSTTTSNPPTDALVRKTSQMSLGDGSGNDEPVIDVGEDALLKELGYRNANDLQETVYGKILAAVTAVTIT